MSNVKQLHSLRSVVLEAALGGQAADRICRQLGCSIEFDISQFVELYEKVALVVDRLTAHQSAKMKECSDAMDIGRPVHMMAAAGSGKTFFLVHLCLKLLHSSQKAYVLVVTQTSLKSKPTCMELVVYHTVVE